MLEQILKGGSMMFPLMALSLVGVAVVFDRWMAFSANRKVDTKSLRAKVQAPLFGMTAARRVPVSSDGAHRLGSRCPAGRYAP